MVNSILITDSGINKVSGGGVVSFNLVEILQSATNLQYILSTQKFPDDKYNNIPAYSINPADYGYSNTDPFFQDYLAFHLLQKEPSIDVCITYGCPMGLTVEELKREFNTKILCDLAPHDISVSKEEHIKFGAKYNYPHLVDTMLWGLYSRHLRFSNKVIVHSKKSAEYIKEKAKLSIDPVVIPHGCYLPTTIPEYPEKFTPSYLGALGMDKGISYLINAWLSCPYPTLQLLIGGKEAQGFKIDDKYMPRFRASGYVENLNDFYKQVSIGVFPSVTEGFNIPALEAMAHGRPVIVAEGAGVSELITDGHDGFIVPIRDINAIGAKIVWFHDNPSEIQRMGTEARKTAEKYEWSKIQESYKALL